jgi:hypothetical protein
MGKFFPRSYHIQDTVGTATGYGLRAGWPEFYSGQGQEIFLSSIEFRPDLWTTQSSIQLEQEALAPRIKQKGREADHSPHLVPRSRMVEL